MDMASHRGSDHIARSDCLFDHRAAVSAFGGGRDADPAGIRIGTALGLVSDRGEPRDAIDYGRRDCHRRAFYAFVRSIQAIRVGPQYPLLIHGRLAYAPGQSRINTI